MPNRIESPRTVTFQEDFKEGLWIDKYTPYALIIGFPSKVDALTLFQQSTAITHELAHHAVYVRTGDFRFANNGVHFCVNKDMTMNKAFRRGLLKSYRMIYYNVADIVKRQNEITEFCSKNEGHPQPYM